MEEVKPSEEAAKRLVDEVAAQGRDVQDFVSVAVLRELSRERFETEEVRKGLADADAGNFATGKEVEAVLSRFTL